MVSHCGLEFQLMILARTQLIPQQRLNKMKPGRRLSQQIKQEITVNKITMVVVEMVESD
jgi:hypothetical protein